MNPTLTIYDLKNTTYSIDTTIILCKEENTTLFCSIPGSKLFIVPPDNELLIIKVQKISLPASEKIILYDKGDLLTAGKVFWALRAAGFESIYLLLGGLTLYNDLGNTMNTDPLSELTIEESSFLPFNNLILKIDGEEKKKSSYFQRVRADEEVHISTPRGELLSVETLKVMLTNLGITYKSGKAIQTYGRYAVVLACILSILGEKHVSVVLGKRDLTGFGGRREESEESNRDIIKGYSVHEHSGEMQNGSYAEVKPVRSDSRRAGTVCGNCECF